MFITILAFIVGFTVMGAIQNAQAEAFRARKAAEKWDRK